MKTRVTRTGWKSGDALEALTSREWLLTNGLGGYACGTLGGITSRRFHGALVAALPAPHGRTMIVNRIAASIDSGETHADLEGGEIFGEPPHQPAALVAVTFEDGLPTWRFEANGVVVEKRVVVPHGRNTACIAWRVVTAGAPVTLRLRPALNVRPHEGNLALDPATAYPTTGEGAVWTVTPTNGIPPIRIRAFGKDVISSLAPQRTAELNFREEQCRGYDHVGALLSIGVFSIELKEGEQAGLWITLEPADFDLEPDVRALWEAELVRREALIDAADSKAHEGMGAELVLAADAFVIRPATREEETAMASRDGAKSRTVIAGYHWFTDWGRDTMISLEGLTLVTGRHGEALGILKTFARHVKDGLIPNMFPEGKNEGLYHTADATLWFFHAIDRYLSHTGDRETLRQLLPTLMDIVNHHVRGTRFGIHVDPSDSLLTQGAEGKQLTWMDAKVDDWVVTPRRGKPVEINALWYNALCVVGRWVEEEYGAKEAAALHSLRQKVHDSFNQRFWCNARDYLYDVVDGDNELRGAEKRDDLSLRPNQLLAISLPNPVLDPKRWPRVLEVAREVLLTPVGLRSLGPREPDFKAYYDGDLRARDAAYHQGTVWGWLAGPYVDAHLKVNPGDIAGARQVVEAFAPHLGEACIGSISEIFDAQSPFVPRGCVAQAWSVAEVLRSWVNTG